MNGAYQTVPAGLAPIPARDFNPWYNWCYLNHPTRSAACAPKLGTGGSTPRTVFTSAGRYNPLYYAAIGEPLLRWPNWTGLLLARLISAALCAAFLASALLSCLQWRRRSPLLTGALFVAATPMVIELAGGVNPSSVEMAAGISFAAAAIPLLLDSEPADVRGWLRRAAVAAIVLAQLRALGPLFVAGWLAVLLLPPVTARLRQLRARRSTWLWSAGVLVSCVSGAAWTAAFKPAALGGYSLHTYTGRQILIREIATYLPMHLQQMVDGFAELDTRPPGFIFMAWMMVLGALTIAGLAWGSWADRWRLGALAAAAFVVPVIIDLQTANLDGFTAQGRYIMPVAAGIPLLAAYMIGRSDAVPVARQASLTRVMVALLLPFQFFSLAWVMIRWQSGIGHSLNPLSGTWHPVTGSALPLLMMTAGLLLLAALAWYATRTPGEAQTAGPRTAPLVAAEPAHDGQGSTPAAIV